MATAQTAAAPPQQQIQRPLPAGTVYGFDELQGDVGKLADGVTAARSTKMRMPLAAPKA
jgi:hypothetical protein